MRSSLVWLMLLVPVSVMAQTSEPEGTVFYVVKNQATVYREANTETPYLELGFREPVFVQETAKGWHRVRTQDGAQGYVPSHAISNVWIRVSKRKKSVYLYQGTELVDKFPADFGYNAFADKERQGSLNNPDDWRTPEGIFFVVRKNPNSQFYRAFVLNYPNAEDAERGMRQGLINRSQYESIVRAADNFEMPPMNTALGGMIELHGDGTGVSSNWTHGCVAVHNSHMDKLWSWVEVGTPVLIEQ